MGEYDRLQIKHNALSSLQLGNDAAEPPDGEYGQAVRATMTEIGDVTPVAIRQFLAEIRQAGVVVGDVDQRDHLRKVALQWWMSLDGPVDVDIQLLPYNERLR